MENIKYGLGLNQISNLVLLMAHHQMTFRGELITMADGNKPYEEIFDKLYNKGSCLITYNQCMRWRAMIHQRKEKEVSLELERLLNK